MYFSFVRVKSVLLFFGDTSFVNLEGGSLIVTATESVIHPKYNNAFLFYDIALIKLPYEIALSDKVQVIQLPEKGDVLGVDVILTASGWGKTSGGMLT